MLIPDPARELTCFRCRAAVDTRVVGYWFLLLAPRGRCGHYAGVTQARAVLCAGCGRDLREWIESNAFAPGEAYERAREGLRSGVSAGC